MAEGGAAALPKFSPVCLEVRQGAGHCAVIPVAPHGCMWTKRLFTPGRFYKTLQVPVYLSLVIATGETLRTCYDERTHSAARATAH